MRAEGVDRQQEEVGRRQGGRYGVERVRFVVGDVWVSRWGVGGLKGKGCLLVLVAVFFLFFRCFKRARPRARRTTLQ
jgi:hypothetical protein